MTLRSLAGIVDTRSGRSISVTQAVRRGIINPADSSFTSTADGQRLTFHEALEHGFIISELVTDNLEMNGDATTIDTIEASSGPSDYEVDNVLDPRTKYRVTLPYAISKGIVEPSRAEYRNPDTGEFMPLSDAVSKGAVKATKVAPGSVKALVNLLQLHETGAMPVRYVLPRTKQDPNSNAYKALSKHMDSNVKAVINHEGCPVSIREAYQTGLIKFDSLSYVREDGSTLSLEEAAQQGLVNMAAMQCILGACKKLSLQNYMNGGRISADGAEFTDGKTSLPIQEAIEKGRLDPYAVYLRDKESGRLMTLGHALDEDILTPEEGQTLERGLQHADILPNISPSAELRSAYVIERLTSDAKDVAITDPSTGKVLPLREAAAAGVYDTQRAETVNPKTGERLSLAEAVQEGLISRKDAKALYDAMDKMSLQHAMR